MTSGAAVAPILCDDLLLVCRREAYFLENS